MWLGMRRPAPRGYKRGFFLLYTAIALAFTAGMSWVVNREATADLVDAVIVSEDSSYRPGIGYTVRFTKSSGETCVSSIERDTLPGNVSVGDTITVRRPRPGDQCLATGELGSHAVVGLLMGLVFLAIGIVGGYVAWFRTAPDGHIRWR